ncbi:MAG: P1 family peptidase [Bacillota bacterium]
MDAEQSSKRRRIREWGIIPGVLPTGKKNFITDIVGVKVGHVSLIRGDGNLKPGQGPIRTGVTAILPHAEGLYFRPVEAGLDIINGYGKALGLIQVEELGRLASPILLTSTLNVPRAADALIDYVLRDNPEIGISYPSFNPVVLECNDGFLNDIQGRHVGAQQVHRAIISASADKVGEGDVGAGTGMTSFGFKGGIGSSSRKLKLGDKEFHLGTLVLNNFGRREELKVNGYPLYKLDQDILKYHQARGGDGSVIVIIATDIPLNTNQLRRVASRATIGLGRVGSLADNGSGDFALAFSTSRTYQRNNKGELLNKPREETDSALALPADLTEKELTKFLFQAVVESTEESVLNSLFMAATVRGRDGNTAYGLPGDKVAAALEHLRVC